MEHLNCRFSHSVFHSSNDTPTINSDLHSCGESEKQDTTEDKEASNLPMSSSIQQYILLYCIISEGWLNSLANYKP